MASLAPSGQSTEWIISVAAGAPQVSGTLRAVEVVSAITSPFSAVNSACPAALRVRANTAGSTWQREEARLLPFSSRHISAAAFAPAGAENEYMAIYLPHLFMRTPPSHTENPSPGQFSARKLKPSPAAHVWGAAATNSAADAYVSQSQSS